ncbi:class I SAM-dependent methyltransferase [Acanthopleuribacter pedis]|uniref:Class I SAM-dependent methyltransferase n=1 Tax=Acanthopleuribacter pedis TaxID=442870 RepID=A0A8J7U7H0_9BACT|nr:class I SAM-dependent methyltransferase [Acanthopleuribacter pedis]MBO1322994.1 class I SAM-dependent methyltransferase [Acanthopleuribacter pedis]
MTNTANPTNSEAWWQTLYDGTVAALFLEREPEQLQRETDCLARLLAVQPGASLFDQCCGTGTQALALARRGFTVHGVDQAAEYAASANAKAKTDDLKATFVAADARSYRPPQRHAAGYNWGTSFGNGLDAADHLAMLEAARDALLPGARFAVEFPNMIHLLGRFQAVLTRRKQLEDGEWLVVRECTIDHHHGALRQTWTILAPDGRRRSVDTSVRLYLPHELREHMEAAGFCEVQLFGAPDGTPLEGHHARCLAVGRAS